MSRYESIDFSAVIQAQNDVQRKIVQRLSKSILKKSGVVDNPISTSYSLKSVKNARDIYELAAYLFVFEDYDLCYKVCSIWDDIMFSGDYTLWSYIKSCKLMKYAILKMNGEQDTAEKIMATVIPYENPELYERVWKTTYANALKIKEEYIVVQPNSSSARFVRLTIMGVAFVCHDFLQLNALPEQTELMQDWYNRIATFLRYEEK